jgi:ATP-dependent Clp protease ATP-binding subunit ClpC
MFEKYTEGARKTIFFARDAAVKRNAESIAPEHLLLGMLRAEPEMIQRLSPDRVDSSDLASEITATLPSESQGAELRELPLSSEAKDVLHLAHEASLAMRHWHVGVEHLLVGLLSAARQLGRSTEGKINIKEFLAVRGYDRQIIEEKIRRGATSA